MVGDELGAKERGWICAGFLVTTVTGLLDPLVLAPDGLAPLLLLPDGWPDALRELAFGWARSDLAEQKRGWLGALRTLAALVDAA